MNKQSKQNISLSAYAKINLGLRIVGKRDDGYHNIVTIFQRISLCDIVTIQKLDGKIKYQGPELTEKPEDNLCYKAAKLFRIEFGDRFGAYISLKKEIPAEAGLGGGSSDAAAVLRGMAKLYNVSTDDERLYCVALKVGSDVSFFLKNIPAALGQGRGEILTPVTGLKKNRWIVIIKPRLSISTSWAYRSVDNILTFEQKDISMLCHELLDYSGGAPTRQMLNDFEQVVFEAYPDIFEIYELMIASGALFAGLCGSGSAVYGVFNSNRLARIIADRFKTDWTGCICRPC
ncbi:4-(cytidine 5'-diphospho)-2-C-methyl-D-erythritol kinase [bacterium]|nr:4-(cytidine 5'-diphospho)-2-C-methyl-D-erythritol kinase [bacterium]